MITYDETSSGAMVTGSGRLVAVTLTAGSAANATAKLYDHRSAASGDMLAALAALQGTSACLTLPGRGVTFENGIYLNLTGADARVIAYVETE